MFHGRVRTRVFVLVGWFCDTERVILIYVAHLFSEIPEAASDGALQKIDKNVLNAVPSGDFWTSVLRIIISKSRNSSCDNVCKPLACGFRYFTVFIILIFPLAFMFI